MVMPEHILSLIPPMPREPFLLPVPSTLVAKRRRESGKGLRGYVYSSPSIISDPSSARQTLLLPFRTPLGFQG